MHLLSPGLRVEGHDVVYVAEATQQTKDIGLADEALRTGRILLTEDKDFGDLAFQEKRAVPGIVLLRFPSARRFMKWPQLKAAIEEHGEALYRGFTVVEEHRIRYWSLAGNGMSGGSSPGGVTSG
jgi:predicted nuclease of predicted toxin-antitoxin system